LVFLPKGPLSRTRESLVSFLLCALASLREICSLLVRLRVFA
jgi:hypothetical protein